MTRARRAEPDDVIRVGRAVADPTRLAVLRAIQAADAPLGVQALADRVGVHANAVRQHLAHLRDAGLVLEETFRTGGLGRPRLVYRADPDSAGSLAGWNPYETLSRLLVQVATGRDPVEVGAEHGRRLADAAPERDPVDVLDAVARRHGFDPTVEPAPGGVDLVLGRCPFAASVTPDRLVCDLHRGMAEGIAARRGGAVVVSLAAAPPHEGGCRFHVRVTAPEEPT